MRIRVVAAVLFHAKGRAGGRTEGQTNMSMLRVTFRNSANAPKKTLYLWLNLKIKILPRSKHSPSNSHS